MIKKDIDVEGIFRRSGSMAKLKELRVSSGCHVDKQLVLLTLKRI